MNVKGFWNLTTLSILTVSFSDPDYISIPESTRRLSVCLHHTQSQVLSRKYCCFLLCDSLLVPVSIFPASSLGERGGLSADGRTVLKRQLKQLLTSCANILSLTLWYSSSLSSIDLLRLSSLNGCILFCWTEKRNQEGYPCWAVKQLSTENNKCSFR